MAQAKQVIQVIRLGRVRRVLAVQTVIRAVSVISQSQEMLAVIQQRTLTLVVVVVLPQ